MSVEELSTLEETWKRFRIVGGDGITVHGSSQHGYAVNFDECPSPIVTTAAGIGACCVTGESCTVISESDCTAATGFYYGDGTTCDPNPCVDGGCCLPRTFDGTWESRDQVFQNCSNESSQSTCESLGGTWWTAFFDPSGAPVLCDSPEGLPNFLLCCDSTPNLDITNCFNLVEITVTLNFDIFGPPECVENSGTATLSKSFTRISFDPDNPSPVDPNFYVITSEGACQWGVRGPGEADFVVSDDVNDQACGTPGIASLGANITLTSNSMIGSFAAIIECGDGACGFNIDTGLGEFDFDTCTLGTHNFTFSDSSTNWSYDVTVAVTLS